MARHDVEQVEEGIDPDYHPSRSMSNRFPEDALLRSRGFRIASRPRKGEAVWSLRGILFRHSDAMMRIKQD